ncbi:Gamma-tubulin complex component 6 [Portunus trituberculatus]|uniref:Gamma-tubulin complex component 6 n=1 Tax=Portunus trituberculatus TaxID=210409 RepID=A0A5B7E7I0_PORTR|nr:Gamma-tubulin complex component 6 [Portunus trituberculatus]
MTLSLPKLPNNAEGYTPFSLSSVTNTTTAPMAISPSCNSGAGGDEGYASSNSAASDSPGDEEDPWEAVLAALPLTNRRTWATLGHIPETKEKPFISEAGEKTSHNIWLLYQELWSIVGGHSIPQLCVRPMKELCQDVLYLLIGVPSHSFPWSDTEECFSIREDLCHSNITPEALRSSLLPLVECGTLVHRLEILFPTPKSDTQQLLTHGSVFTAFTFAISSVLQVHREMVLSLGDETLLSALQDKAQPLVKKIKFVASVCKVSLSNNKVKLPAAPGINDKKQQGSVDESCAGLPRGLCLLGELLHRITTTTDRDCLLLLISIFRSACIPFFRYLEEWIYHGVCSDPGLEFMIEVNGAALLRRDRTYWTSGYTLRPQTSVPAMFLDVLEEAFVCGKTINLLRLCSGKHYLVAGNHDQPHMQLCVSGEELTHMQEKCQHYSANMDLLAAQLQVTVQQKAEEEKAHKHRLQLISSNKHAAVLREIESKMQEHNQLVKEEKAVRLKELKDEMLKAEKRKQEEKEKEAKNDWNIAQEQQEIEKRQIEQEEALRAKVEQFYQQKIKEAERAEAVARWRMQRCSLSAVRKHHIQHTSWPPVPEDASSKNMEEEILDLASPQTPDSLPEQPETPDQEQVLCGGALKRPRNMNTRPDSQMHYRAKGCTFAPYHLQTEKSEELLKESPNQEVSSVSDMTASLMSTSSDFVDTPFDENLPDFESDSKIQTIPESGVIENENYAYMKSSIEAILYDNGNGNANLPSSTTAETVNAPPIMLTESPDANANIPETITILETSQNETQPQNTSDNSNTANQNLNELVLQFRERRAQAAAIKEKVLNEYHQTTTASKNNMNILRSRVIPSSAAARNKQRVMETEFGMADTELQEAGGHGMYSRQVSNTSTCSFRSCSSSERPTSSSTAFTTPDEERPILIDQDPTPPSSPCTPPTEITPIKDMVEATLKSLPTQHKTSCYDLEYMKLMDQEPLLDITGSALRGKPNTRPSTTTTSPSTSSTTSTTTTSTTAAPSTLELSCVPVYFIRSIRVHLTTQSQLVNESLLAEMLVEGRLLDHFKALRSLLLLHDAHFARALTSNLFGKLEPNTCPATLLIPSKLNNILYKSVAESCWSSSSQADNLSFAVTSIPLAFSHNSSVVDCLELRYRVTWPHNLVLDDSTLASYSRVWSFLASLHHVIWASDNLFIHISFLNRQDKESRLSRSPQFHQLCLHRHKMHHFLLALQAYVISQIHQISWSRLEEKLHAKVTSLDHLYSLHASFIKAIISRCFLSQNGQVVHQLIKDVFSSTLRFCSQFLAHPWVPEDADGTVMVHPAFNALKDTFQEFETRAAFLHKCELGHHAPNLLCDYFQCFYFQLNQVCMVTTPDCFI